MVSYSNQYFGITAKIIYLIIYLLLSNSVINNLFLEGGGHGKMNAMSEWGQTC